jgi:hypothetical protein
MNRVTRETPLPAPMLGRWVDADDSSSELVIVGGEITCYGALVDYDYKEVSDEGGALIVSLRVNDPSRVDSFQRANIANLVITPEGEFLVSNVKFGARFVRSS